MVCLCQGLLFPLFQHVKFKKFSVGLEQRPIELPNLLLTQKCATSPFFHPPVVSTAFQKNVITFNTLVTVALQMKTSHFIQIWKLKIFILCYRGEDGNSQNVLGNFAVICREMVLCGWLFCVLQTKLCLKCNSGSYDLSWTCSRLQGNILQCLCPWPFVSGMLSFLQDKQELGYLSELSIFCSGWCGVSCTMCSTVRSGMWTGMPFSDAACVVTQPETFILCRWQVKFTGVLKKSFDE